MKTVLDVPCPTCHAEASKECDWSKFGFAQPHPDFHTTRFDAALAADASETAAANAGDSGEPSVAAVEKTVARSFTDALFTRWQLRQGDASQDAGAGTDSTAADLSVSLVMPNAPKRPCGHPRCRNLVEGGGRCSTHRTGEARGTAAQRGYDSRWQRFRKWFLAQPENVLCRDCETAIATDVHHVKKLREFPELKYDERWLMPLCARCHAKRSAKGE